MFLPISDSPNPQGVPYATWTILAINVVVFLFVNLPLGSVPADVNDPAYREYLQFLSQNVSSNEQLAMVARQVSGYDLFVFKHGFRPAVPSVIDLGISMFLHGGLMHLFGNMLFLFIYGDNVEHRLGVGWFVVWYLVTGAAATMFHAMFFSASNVPLVGASGAISGVLGFYFIWFPKNVVRVLVFLPPFFAQTFQIAARIVLAVYLFLDNILPFLFAGGGGVAHGAHIGGFVAGAAVASGMNWWFVTRTPPDVKKAKKMPAGERAVRQAIEAGDLDEAASDYFALGSSQSRRAVSVVQATAMARRLRAQGRPEAALTLLLRVIRGAPRAGGMGEAYALAGSILLEDLHDTTAAYQYLVAALRFGEISSESTAEVRRNLAIIEAQQRLRAGRVDLRSH